MTCIEAYCRELDREIRHFAAGCEDDDVADEALILADRLLNSLISLEGAERELARLQGDQ